MANTGGGPRRRRLMVVTVMVLALLAGVGLFGAALYGSDPFELLLTRDDDGCPHRVIDPLVSVDWAGDFVQYDGARYLLLDGATVGDQVGRRVGAITCTVGDAIATAGQLRDFHALFLPVGTPLHALAGTDPGFRLAALDETGSAVVYEVDSVPGASTAERLLPRPEAVDRIVFATGSQERTVEDPARLLGLVAALRSAPMDVRGPAGIESTPPGTIRMVIANQPPKILDVWPVHGWSLEGIQLPQDVAAAFP